MKARKWVAFTLVFMAVGVIMELFLISHYEDAWQLVPIILIVLTVLGFIVLLRSPAGVLKKVFQALLAACVVSGLMGIYFHINANWEFESELHPGQSMSATFVESLSGAFPALAPASMIVFALIGYIYLIQIDNNSTHETTR